MPDTRRVVRLKGARRLEADAERIVSLMVGRQRERGANGGIRART
jgi:hypothetical protein